MSTAGERAGEVVDATVREAESAAAEAVQRANAEAQAAQQTAEQIAAAARESEIGKMYTGLETRVSTWQTETGTALQNLTEQNRILSEQLTALSSSIRPPSAPTHSSNPPSAPASGPTDGSSIRTAPSERPEERPPVRAEADPQPAPKKRHFL